MPRTVGVPERNNRRLRPRRGHPGKVDYPLPDEKDRLPTSKSEVVAARLNGTEACKVWDDCREICPWLSLDDMHVVEVMANQWQLAVWSGRQMAKYFEGDRLLETGELKDLAMLRPMYAGAVSQSINAMGLLGMTLDARREMQAKLKAAAEADQRDDSSDDLF